MKEKVEKQQAAAPAQLKQEGGQSMNPPAFGLTAAPIQAQTAEGDKDGNLEAAAPAPTPNDILAEKLAAIDDPKNAKTKKAKAIEMMNFVREQEATYPAKIQSYIGQPNPTVEEKLRVMGEITALAGRAEWLIGSIYLEGSDGDKKWESSANNDSNKVLAGYYQKQTGSDGKEFGATPWCTKFLGTVMRNVLGMHTKAGKKPNGELWSGAKLGRGDYFDYAGEGGKHVGKGSTGFEKGKDQNVWVNYRKSLEAEKDPAKRATLAEDFMTKNIRPQAGDAMIIKRPKAAANSYDDKSQSHTTMIERLDGHTIYTIEGNADDRLMGRSYDLTNATDVGKIIFIGRMSIDAYKKPLAKGEVAKPWEGVEVSETDLKAPLQSLVDQLTTYAQGKNYINAPAEGQLDVIKNRQRADGSDKAT